MAHHDNEVTSMAKTPVDRFLRRVSALSFFWALAFLIPYGVKSRNAVPPLLLIPQGLSFFVALYRLSDMSKNRRRNLFLDVFVALYLLAMIIPAAIFIRHGRYYWDWRSTNTTAAMLGVYGTMPAMINFLIHTYFALREMYVCLTLGMLFGSIFSSPTCPHCQREVIYSWSRFGASTPGSSASKESYVAVDGEDTDDAPGRPSSSKGPMVEPYRDPRPSTEDESARLV